MTRVLKGETMWDAGNADNRYKAALRLFGALSGVEEDYLAACEADAGAAAGRKAGRVGALSGAAAPERASAGEKESFGVMRFVWKYGKTMAAVLVIAVLGVSYLSFRIGVFPEAKKNYSGGTPMAIDKESHTGAAYDSAVCDELSELPVEAANVEEAVNVEAAGDAETEELEADKIVETPDLKKEAEKGRTPSDGSVQGGSQTFTDNDRNGSGAGAGEGAASRDSASGEEKMQGDHSQTVENLTENVGCPEDPAEEMTLDEAKTLPVVGGYLPDVWPAEGRLESVKGSGGEGEESVTVTWTYGNGWDSFTVSVTDLGNVVPEWISDSLVDRSKPETYDRRLYEIPYADTVPAEYRTVFGSPVFWQEDLDRECVAARVLPAADDGGDTDTPRGNFGVLCRTEEGGYVLVKFSGRGSVDEIWTLMQSVH